MYLNGRSWDLYTHALWKSSEKHNIKHATKQIDENSSLKESLSLNTSSPFPTLTLV